MNPQQKYFKKTKESLFNILGGKICNCTDSRCFCKGKCKVIDERCLQFDHINGGGSKQYKKIGPYSLWIYYVKNPEIAKQDIQILCSNCNSCKKHISKQFPYLNKNAKIIYK